MILRETGSTCDSRPHTQRLRGSGLQFVVLLVSPDPRPDEHLAVEPGNRAVVIADARRPFAVAVRTKAQ